MQTTTQKTERDFSEVITDVPEPEAAAREIESLREELALERDSRLRLAAEFDNYRRRVRREHAEAAHAGKRELLEQLISIADDLDLAIANLDDDNCAQALDLLVKQAERCRATLLIATHDARLKTRFDRQLRLPLQS